MWLIVVALLLNSKSKKTIWNLNPEANSSLMLVFFRLYGRGMSVDKAKDTGTEVLFEVNLVKMYFLSHLRWCIVFFRTALCILYIFKDSFIDCFHSCNISKPVHWKFITFIDLESIELFRWKHRTEKRKRKHCFFCAKLVFSATRAEYCFAIFRCPSISRRAIRLSRMVYQTVSSLSQTFIIYFL